MSPMKAGERLGKPEWCIVMAGFDGEYYIFNEKERRFIETDGIGAYALSLIDGKRSFKQIADAVCEKFAETGANREEIYRSVTETFEAAFRIGAVKKKRLPW